MTDAAPAASIVVMPSAERLPRTATSVLVVRASPIVGVALAERLARVASVRVADVAGAHRILGAGARPDAVVLCPYLSAHERAGVLAAAVVREPEPAVVHVLHHGSGAPTLRLLAPLDAGDAAARRAGAPLREILEALA